MATGANTQVPVFRRLAENEMSEAQLKVYRDLASGPRGGVRGPFNALLRSPVLADRAQKLGVDPKIIEALRAKAPIDDFTGRERLLIEFTRTLVHDHTVPEPLFARMASEFGRAKFIEAVGLLGHYMTIGTVIRLFEVKVPEGIKTF